MKRMKYLIAALIGLVTVSCFNMDITPVNILGEQVLLNSDAGIRKYMAIAYHDLPVEDFNYYVNNGYTITDASNNRWQGQKNSPSNVGAEAIGHFNSQYEDFGYWDFNGIEGGAKDVNGPYFRIRGLNHFLAQLPKFASNFSEAEVLAYQAEARTLRAYYYFALARRYGGVVWMDETNILDPLADPLTLMLPRETEYNTWKHIYEDLKFAMDNGAIPSQLKNFEMTGRANRYTAAALMSRAMLYAGTIAKYGQTPGIAYDGPSFQAGYQGMPREAAKEFFQYAIDGAKRVEEGGYALHTGADKEKAFVEVFQNATKEDIFVKAYGTGYPTSPFAHVYLVHSWDGMVLPQGEGLSGDTASGMNPTWTIIDLYDHPAIEQPDPSDPTRIIPVRFNSREAFWQSAEMEPRCRATFYFSGMTETTSGTKFDIQTGVYTNYKDGKVSGTVAQGTENVPESATEWTKARRTTSDEKSKTMSIAGFGTVKITGEHGTRQNSPEQRSQGAAVIRKYVSTNTARKLHTSVQSWKALRYGEVVLNRAEALYELGLETSNETLKAEAFTFIAQIRDRAGAKPYEMKAAPGDVTEMGLKNYDDFKVDENLQFIRDERSRELAFENHRIYDFIRWRIAHYEFPDSPDGFRIKQMRSYKVLDEDKWIFLPEPRVGNSRLAFPIRKYYNGIPGGVRSKNPKIVQNDGH